MNGDSLMKLVPSVEYRHAALFARIRIGVGVWLLILTAIRYRYDRGTGHGGCLQAGTRARPSTRCCAATTFMRASLQVEGS
jgi:hypothetical protein